MNMDIFERLEALRASRLDLSGCSEWFRGLPEKEHARVLLDLTEFTKRELGAPVSYFLMAEANGEDVPEEIQVAIGFRLFSLWMASQAQKHRPPKNRATEILMEALEEKEAEVWLPALRGRSEA